jgi:hypothetical protein
VDYSATRAKKEKKDSLKALSSHLKDAYAGFKEVLTDQKKTTAPHEKSKIFLTDILNRIESLCKDIDTSKNNFNISTTYKQISDIIKLFKKINVKIRLLKKTYLAETSIVMANSSILMYKDSLHVLKIPNIKRLNIFDFEKVAKRIKKHFPVFLGCTIETGSDSKAIKVKFSSMAEPVQTVLKALEPKVEKLLIWGMYLVGDSMHYEIYPWSQGNFGMLYCELSDEPFVYDPSS